MTKDKTAVKLGIQTRLKKYGKGKNPEVDEPDEVIERVFEVSGDKAKKIIQAKRGEK